MNNILTKLLGVCFAAAMVSLPAAAFNDLVVHTTDAQQRFSLASIDQLTFGEQGLNVGMAEVDNFTDKMLFLHLVLNTAEKRTVYFYIIRHVTKKIAYI